MLRRSAQRIRLGVAPWLAVLLLASVPAQAASMFTTEREVTKVAEGVYVIRHQDPARGWVHGNTTVIIGARGVFVVDSTQTARAAREDIAQIRQWTNKPVLYVLNTHWHTDHNGGNDEYLRTFPALTILAHRETRAMEDAYNPSAKKNWASNVSQMRDNINKMAQTGMSPMGKPLTAEQKARIPERLAQADQLDRDGEEYVYQAPTLMFDSDLTVDLGGREVQVMHPGRGNTGGDAIVYLGKEKLLATGDLLVYPVPFTFDGYPREWVQTLDTMGRLEADTIVPGHGPILHDKSYLFQVRDLMKSVIAQVDEQFRKNDDVSLEEVRKTLDVSVFRSKMAGGDEVTLANFDGIIVQRFVELVYYERKAR